VREIILERFPYLAHVPADAPNGIDTPLPPPPPISWEKLSVVVPISPGTEGSEDQPESSTKGHDLDNGAQEEIDEAPTWHDVALSIAAELMEKIRDTVRTKLGYTTSAVSAVLILTAGGHSHSDIFYRESPRISSWPRSVIQYTAVKILAYHVTI